MTILIFNQPQHETAWSKTSSLTTRISIILKLLQTPLLHHSERHTCYPGLSASGCCEGSWTMPDFLVKTLLLWSPNTFSWGSASIQKCDYYSHVMSDTGLLTEIKRVVSNRKEDGHLTLQRMFPCVTDHSLSIYFITKSLIVLRG